MLVRPQKTLRDCRKPETNAMECERIGMRFLLDLDEAEEDDSDDEE